MPLVTMLDLLDAAAAGDYAVGAFGISNMEQAQAIGEAAHATQSPVIVMISNKNVAYAGWPFLSHLARAMHEQWPDVPMALHLDHGGSLDECREAIDHGCTSVMIDGSLAADGTPRSFEDNVAVTREVVEYAAAHGGVTVEGELGTLGRTTEGAQLTDPDQAVEFVERTGVDALAVAIGTSHGAYKFQRAAPDESVLAMGLIDEIAGRLPDTHLVLHGASSVPVELVERINAHGGSLAQAHGVPMAELQRAIRAGVRKINVDTDGRLAFTAGVREAFAADSGVYDPRVYLGAAKDAVREVVAERMRDFGQAGRGVQASVSGANSTA